MPEHLHGGEHRLDLGAQQQGAGGLHRGLHPDRAGPAQLGHGVPGGPHRALDLAQVLGGLDEDGVHPALAPGPRIWAR